MRGRYAPTPSGLLHVGNARTALVAWLSVRSRGGTFIVRTEDLDPPRMMPGAAEAVLEDLAWLGLDWDEGPDAGGPYAPYVQSERSAFYEEALRRLAEQDLLFPCARSRKDLRELASAPHGGGDLPAYPREWRPDELEEGWLERFLVGDGADQALRFKVHDRPVVFEDLVLGRQEERVDQEVGDFVLRRRDGLWAYQLAVVVDDLAMGITEVVRGVDLLASTARQIQLIEALGAQPPAYAHLPLILNAEGEKLSKRDQGITLRELREGGMSAPELVGRMAESLGLIDDPRPTRPADLVGHFGWERLGTQDGVLPLPEVTASPRP